MGVMEVAVRATAMSDKKAEEGEFMERRKARQGHLC